MKKTKSLKTNISASLFFFVIHGFGVSRFFFVGYIDIVTSREKKEEEIRKQEKEDIFSLRKKLKQTGNHQKRIRKEKKLEIEQINKKIFEINNNH